MNDTDKQSPATRREEKGEYRKLQTDMQDLATRVTNLETKLDTIIKETGIDVSRGSSGERGIAFMLYMNEHVAVRSLQTLVFDDVKLNVGNGYDPETGVFTVPVSGRYLLSLTVRAQYQKQACAEIIADHVLIGQVAAGDSEIERATSTVTIMAALPKNSEVYVRETKTWTGHFYGDGFTTFCGVFLD